MEANLIMLLQKNIDALRIVQQNQIADLIGNLPEEKLDFKIVKGKTNKDVLLLKNKLGNFVLTQSMYDPLRFNERRYLGHAMKDASFIIVLGLALEHDLLYALQSKRENAFIVVIEPSISLIRLALERIDCAELIMQNKIRFFYEDLKYLDFSIGGFLSIPHIIFMATHPFVVATIRSQISDNEYFLEAAKVVLKRANYNRIYIGNSIEDSLIGFRNIVSNIKSCIDTKKLDFLKGKYEKKPAVVVATGPSLDKNIELLKQLEGKVLIISTESAIVPLTKHNIVPDVIIVLERIPESYDYHFKGRTFHEKTVLVALSMLDPRILEEWKGEKVLIFREAEIMNLWFRSMLLTEDGLSAGESVSTMGFDFADYLGCEPICFVGLDLAYSPDGISHSKESTYIAEAGDNNKSYVNLIDNFEKLPVEDIYGDIIFSNSLWLRFKDWLEIRLVDKPDLCIDATEGGAYVKGTTVMPLREVIERVHNETVIPLVDVIRELNQNQSLNAKEEEMNLLLNMKKRVREQRTIMTTIVRKMRNVLKKQSRIAEEINKDLSSKEITTEIMEVMNESKDVLNLHFSHSLTIFFLQSVYASLYTKLNNIGLVNTRLKLLATVCLEQDYFQLAQHTLRKRVGKELKSLELKVNSMLKQMESAENE